MDYKTFGNNVAKKMEEIGMSNRELAEKVGVTEVSMSRYLCGERTPKAPIIANIAKVLGTTFEELMGIEPAQKNVREQTCIELDDILRNGLLIRCESEEVMNDLLEQINKDKMKAHRIEDKELGEFVIEVPPVK